MIYTKLSKKFITLTVIIMTAAIVAWCGSKKDTTSASTNTGANPTCQSAIQAYLSGTDMKWRGDRQIKTWDNIVVDYVGRLSDSEIFDTSVESVAQACGKYASGRDYKSWLPFKYEHDKWLQDSTNE